METAFFFRQSFCRLSAGLAKESFMLGDPRVSACLVLYNSGATVGETARCIAQSREKIELYVVDNSPKALSKRFIDLHCPDFHYLPQKRNIGFGRANNLVLPMLKSRYHLLINPDITFDPDLVGRMCRYMDANPDIAILTPKVFNRDGTEQFLPRKRPTVRYLLGGPLESFGDPYRKWRAEYTMEHEHVEQPTDVEFATGCFMLIRTHTFRKLNGFDPRYFLYLEDGDLTLKALRAGRVVYHPDMQVIHDWHRDSAHHLKQRIWHVHSAMKFFWKWGLRW